MISWNYLHLLEWNVWRAVTFPCWSCTPHSLVSDLEEGRRTIRSSFPMKTERLVPCGKEVSNSAWHCTLSTGWEGSIYCNLTLYFKYRVGRKSLLQPDTLLFIPCDASLCCNLTLYFLYRVWWKSLLQPYNVLLVPVEGWTSPSDISRLRTPRMSYVNRNLQPLNSVCCTLRTLEICGTELHPTPILRHNRLVTYRYPWRQWPVG